MKIDFQQLRALSNVSLYEGDAKLKIEVDVNKYSRSITIRDNGIDMSREEVIKI